MKSAKGQWESDYWSRLNTFKLLSIQRRIERFIIIYSWKSLENLVPDIGLSSHVHPHKGRLLRIPNIPRSTMSIKTLRDRTRRVTGLNLFNCLPMKIQNLSNCPISTFKNMLDVFLSKVPDMPLTNSLTPPAISISSGRHSNSLLDAIIYFRETLRDKFSISQMDSYP